MTTAISVKNLSKTYKIFSSSTNRAIDAIGIPRSHTSFDALKNVSLEFEEGEVYGILGRNGSGKSTLLKIITGVVFPTSGSVTHKGRISAMLELTSGFYNDLTGIENIQMKALALGISKEDFAVKEKEIIEFADIGEHINQPFRTYSSGMKARLGFSLAVNIDPDILIIDEALSVGDSIFKLKCLDKMREFRASGKTILFVSHSIGTVKAFCTKGIWINQGEVVASGELGEVAVKYEVFLKDERRKLKEEKIARSTDAAIVQRGYEKRDLVQISKFAFKNQDGEANANYLQGKAITWEYSYEVKQKVGDLCACFSVFDAELNEIFALDKRRYRVENSIGVHTARFTIDTPNLLGGKYLLSGEIWEIDSAIAFIYANRRPFTIVGDEYVGTGIVLLNHTFAVDGNEISEPFDVTTRKDMPELTLDDELL